MTLVWKLVNLILKRYGEFQRSVSEMNEALTLIFKNASIGAQIKTLGLKMIILENALKMNCHVQHAKKVYVVLLRSLAIIRTYPILGAVKVHLTKLLLLSQKNYLSVNLRQW